MKTALITGVTGQDGSYLTELLLEKDYRVFGLIRRSSQNNLDNLRGVLENPNFSFLEGDLGDQSSIYRAVQESLPDEIYNLGAQSHVGTSFSCPEYTANITGIGALRLLEAILEIVPFARFYQASSSEMFGKVHESPQKEDTLFHPRSPYGAAKAYAHFITQNYRESYGIFACNGILFNHESPRRGLDFVTRKITSGVIKIERGLIPHISLGNLDAKRDWGHARDYVRAMWLMLQQDSPADYVVATGETYSVRTFAEMAFFHRGIRLAWEGEGVNEVGLGPTGKPLVCVDPQFYRPAEVDLLLGNPLKAREALGWQPESTLESLVQEMLENDLRRPA